MLWEAATSTASRPSTTVSRQSKQQQAEPAMASRTFRKLRAHPLSPSPVFCLVVSVWRSSVSLFDMSAMQDTCGLPALTSGCSGYGLLCLPPALAGGESTYITWSNTSFSISCSACPSGSSSSTNPATAAAIAFGFAFGLLAVYLYWVYRKADAAGMGALFGFSGSAPASSTGEKQIEGGSAGLLKETSSDGKGDTAAGQEESKEAYQKL
jgi:hypothetical protein